MVRDTLGVGDRFTIGNKDCPDYFSGVYEIISVHDDGFKVKRIANNWKELE